MRSFYLALSAFVGSIFGHIILGTIGGLDIKTMVVILDAKVLITKVLIFGGLGLLALSGLGLVYARGGFSFWPLPH